MFHQNEISPIIISRGTILCSLLYLNSRLGLIRLKYLYPVISVIVDLLPANTKMSGINKFVDGPSAVFRILGGMSHIGMHHHVWYMIYRCVMSCIWNRYVSHVSESCQCAVFNIWIRRVALVNTSCRTYESVMSHMSTRHVTHVNAPCLKYENVMSHWRQCFLSRVNTSCHTCICASCLTYENWLTNSATH